MISPVRRSLPTLASFTRTCQFSNTAITKMSAPAPYTVVKTDKAPAAIGPYVQAVKHNGLIYASGSIPLHATDGSIVGTTIEEQTQQVFKNISGVLAAAGSDFDHVLKTTNFLKDMNDFVAFNKVYAEYFPDNKPARSTVEVARLPKDVLVEVEFIAVEKK